MATTISTTSHFPDEETNKVGLRLKNLVLTEELMSNHELTLVEKLVLAYCQQVEPFAAHYDSCELFLDISHGDVYRAKKHLINMGYIGGENDL